MWDKVSKKGFRWYLRPFQADYPPKLRSMFLFSAAGIIILLLSGCVPRGVGPTPRELRKNPQLADVDLRRLYPDSLLSEKVLIEFPYRDVEEIKLSWKMVAGLKLKHREIIKLRAVIQDNVRKYWKYRFPSKEIPSIALENVSVMDAQILLDEGYPLLLYSAYDIKHRHYQFSFESYDICIGYQGITSPRDTDVSFKLNSGLRGYVDSKTMLTGSLLDVPKLKNSKVQVLQVKLFMPPGQQLEDIHKVLRLRYEKLGIGKYTLPVKEMVQPVGNFR